MLLLIILLKECKCIDNTRFSLIAARGLSTGQLCVIDGTQGATGLKNERLLFAHSGPLAQSVSPLRARSGHCWYHFIL